MCVVPEAETERTLALWRQHSRGAEAACIDAIVEGAARVEMRAARGGRRALRIAIGELVPRIG